MLVRRRSEAGSDPLGCLYFSPGVGAMIFEIAPLACLILIFCSRLSGDGLTSRPSVAFGPGER